MSEQMYSIGCGSKNTCSDIVMESDVQHASKFQPTDIRVQQQFYNLRDPVFL